MKTTGVTLWRLRPPFRKRVVLGQITIAGFMELLTALARKAAEVKIEAGTDIVPEDIIRALREPEFNALADSICKDEERGFFSGWLSLRNVTRLYQASFKVNDWGRVFSVVDWKGGQKKSGGMMVDIQTICHLFPGLDPMTVQNDWPMEQFLAFVDALNIKAQADDNPEPVSIGILGTLPGMEIVH